MLPSISTAASRKLAELTTDLLTMSEADVLSHVLGLRNRRQRPQAPLKAPKPMKPPRAPKPKKESKRGKKSEKVEEITQAESDQPS